MKKPQCNSVGNEKNHSVEEKSQLTVPYVKLGRCGRIPKPKHNVAVPPNRKNAPNEFIRKTVQIRPSINVMCLQCRGVWATVTGKLDNPQTGSQCDRYRRQCEEWFEIAKHEAVRVRNHAPYGKFSVSRHFANLS